jgi:hypothetical protein
MNEPLVQILVAFASGTLSAVLTWGTIEFLRGRRKREDILASLSDQVEALDKLTGHNRNAVDDLENPPPHILPAEYPTIPFELALFSA